MSTSTAKTSPSVGVSLSINLVEVLKYVILAAPFLYIYRHKPQDDFLEQLEVLKEVRVETETTVKGEEGRTRRRRRREVQRWMDDVDSFLENEVRVFETSYFPKVPLVCHVYCWLLNLSNRVEKLTKRRQEIQDPLVGVTPLPTLPEDPRMTVVEGKDTLVAIRDHISGDNAVKIVGIHGMAGIGKSAYMNIIAQELREGANTKDDLIIWASLSTGEPNFQNAIGNQLGLSQSPNLTAAIRDMLSGSKFFLFLDDVQEELRWDDIGIPLSKPGDKIIFTTRSWWICNALRSQSIVKVNLLNREESLDLFTRRLVDVEVADEQAKEAFVDKCGGLPHVLRTVADALTLSGGRDEDWRMASEWWGAPTSGPGMPIINSLIPALKIFQPYLTPSNEPRRECLLYCCLFPRGQSICHNKLVDYWIGEGFLGDSSRHVSNWNIVRYWGSQLILEFKEDCLLSSIDQWKVRLHDVVSRAAVWLTAGEVDQSNIYLTSITLNQFLLGQLHDGAWRDAKRISYVGSNRKVLLSDNMQVCSNLLTLLLYNYNDVNRISRVPLNFYKHTSTLRVLDLSGLVIDHLLNGIESLVQLHYLNLSYTNIRTLPMGLKTMKKLRQLNLRGTSFLQCIPEDSISKLVSLQALDLFASNYIWKWKWQVDTQEQEKQVDLDCLAKELHDLCELGLTITGRSSCLEELYNSCLRVSIVFLQLNNVEHFTDIVGNLENLRELSINCPQTVELNISNDQLKKLEFLWLTNVKVVVSPAPAAPLLKKLRSLVISYQDLPLLLPWVELLPAQVMISLTGPVVEEITQPMTLESFISRVRPNMTNPTPGELRLDVGPAM